MAKQPKLQLETKLTPQTNIAGHKQWRTTCPKFVCEIFGINEKNNKILWKVEQGKIVVSKT